MGSTLDHPTPTESCELKKEVNIDTLIYSINLSGHSSGNDIESESKEVERLVLAAKMGQWEVVWSILGTPEHPRKSYMLNAIPQHRRWGVIHQVVYWQDQDVLMKILKFPGCDKKLKAKECLSECGATGGMTPRQIARKYRYSTMKHTLKTTHIYKSLDGAIATFQPYDGYCDNKGLCLISLTLASYKEAFHPKPVDPKRSIMSLLYDIFRDIDKTEDRWKVIRDIVADSVFPVSKAKASDISKCEEKEQFFGQVVNAYTDENNQIYTYLNVAFRRQSQQNYAPTGDDLAMGPYCVMYQMLLLFWDDLVPESETTYRTMKLTNKDIEKYTFGTRFVWQSVVSSAMKEKHTHMFPTRGPSGDIPVLFVIDNSTKCKWQPRNIEQLAQYEETERTYPAGARFIVTGRSQKDGQLRVSLKLLAN